MPLISAGFPGFEGWTNANAHIFIIAEKNQPSHRNTAYPFAGRGYSWRQHFILVFTRLNLLLCITFVADYMHTSRKHVNN